jgi:NAD(P)-dependent dehydrogenase (short-subunit alcohol dehydrogenase family)
MSRGELSDKVVAITGAGKGLGRAYALHLAGLGASVVVNNRRHAGESVSSADRVVEEIRDRGGSAVAEYSSVEDLQAGAALLDTALRSFGRLDALVANAGVSEGRTFHKQELEEFRQVIEINLMGTVNVVHPVFRRMYEQGKGVILVSSSVAGLYGEHGLPAYSTSKAALLGLMYSLASEGAKHGVRVNALAPFASTQMTSQNMPPALDAQLQADRVAPVVAWLISDHCTLNGETIITGAGRMARARSGETASLALPDETGFDPASLQAAWEALRNRPLDRNFSGALAQFGRFMTD